MMDFDFQGEENNVAKNASPCSPCQAKLKKTKKIIFHCRIIHSHLITDPCFNTGPHSSVGSTEDLRTGGCWFDPQHGQCSLCGLMIVIATGFILLSPLSIVSTIVIKESSQWLGKYNVQSTG